MAFHSNKAPGHDKVRMGTTKYALPCVFPVITDMINRSWLQTLSISLENIRCIAAS
jgi:hypothetical protein